MRTITRSVTRVATAAAIATAALAVTTGTAAADEWPVQQPNSPIYVFEAHDFLTPSDLDYWNPLVDRSRLTSPSGTAPASSAPASTASPPAASRPTPTATPTSSRPSR